MNHIFHKKKHLIKKSHETKRKKKLKKKILKLMLSRYQQKHYCERLVFLLLINFVFSHFSFVLITESFKKIKNFRFGIAK